MNGSVEFTTVIISNLGKILAGVNGVLLVENVIWFLDFIPF